MKQTRTMGIISNIGSELINRAKWNIRLLCRSFENKRPTINTLDDHRMAGSQVMAEAIMRKGIVTYRINGKESLVLAPIRTTKIYPHVMDNLLLKIHRNHGFSPWSLASARGMDKFEILSYANKQKDSDNPANVIGRTRIVVPFENYDEELIKDIVDDVTKVFDILPVDQVLDPPIPFEEVPYSGGTFLEYNLSPDSTLFVAEEIALMARTSGIPSLFSQGDIYLGIDRMSKKRASFRLDDLSSKIIFILGPTGTGKSVLTEQMLHRISGRGKIVLDLGGASQAGVGWNTDTDFYSFVLPSDTIIDPMSFPGDEKVFINIFSSFITAMGLEVSENIKNILSLIYNDPLYHDIEVPSMKMFLKALKQCGEDELYNKLKEVMQRYKFVTYPRNCENIQVDVSPANNTRSINVLLMFSYHLSNMTPPDVLEADRSLYQKVFIVEEIVRLTSYLDEGTPLFNKEKIKDMIDSCLAELSLQNRKRDQMIFLLGHLWEDIISDPMLYKYFRHAGLKLIFDPNAITAHANLLKGYNLEYFETELQKNLVKGKTAPSSTRTMAVFCGIDLKLVDIHIEPSHQGILVPEYSKHLGTVPLIIKGEIPAKHLKKLKLGIYYPEVPELPPLTVYIGHKETDIERALVKIVLGAVCDSQDNVFYFTNTLGEKPIDVAIWAGGEDKDDPGDITFVRKGAYVFKGTMTDNEMNISGFINLLQFLTKNGVDLSPLNKWKMEEYIEYAKWSVNKVDDVAKKDKILPAKSYSTGYKSLKEILEHGKLVGGNNGRKHTKNGNNSSGAIEVAPVF